MDGLTRTLMVALGGAVGASARYWLAMWIIHRTGPEFPWATWVINVSGSFAIGFLSIALMRWLPHPYAALLFMTGFLGGFTTYSTFALESLVLWRREQGIAAIGYVGGTLIAGLVAVTLGASLATGLVGKPSTIETTSIRHPPDHSKPS